MILRSLFFAGILSITAKVVAAQQSYNGTLVLKTGGKQTGTFTVNLDGENNELMEISKVEKIRSKGSKSTVTTSTKINTAIISYIIVENTTYYIRDMKTGYDE